MHIPTQEQWQTVIDKLESVLPLATREDHLNMGQFLVNGMGYPCGTVHCVGGWYAIAHYGYKAIRNECILSYSDGAIEMATDLGFGEYWNRIYALEKWAHEHSSLWGNNRGMYVFSDASAYDHGSGPAENISDVIYHLKFVKQNCYEYQINQEAK